MRGFAFQVDRLVSLVEDYQLLHELSLEDDAIAEDLERELDLSKVLTDSPMSSVAPLPPDPVSTDPVVESGVAQLPPDELDCGEVDCPCSHRLFYACSTVGSLFIQCVPDPVSSEHFHP